MLLQDAMISEIPQSEKPGTYGIGRYVLSGSIELSEVRLPALSDDPCGHRALILDDCRLDGVGEFA